MSSSQPLPPASDAPPSKPPPAYPSPFVISPLSTHTHTIIVLHGRGDTAKAFGPCFLISNLSSGQTLSQRFPGLKFVFPTAAPRRVAVSNRATLHQWFDLSSLVDPDESQELQYRGLCESAAFLANLVREEVALVGARNVVVGGLSQGCAMGLHLLLGYGSDGAEALGGFFGMSGWLPFWKQLNEIVDAVDVAWESGDGDPFERDKEEMAKNKSLTAAARAVDFVRKEIMGLPSLKSTLPLCLKTPIWMGHGVVDGVVAMKLGEKAVNVMEKLGWEVTWKSYEDLDHWYLVPDEIDDIAMFLRDRVGVPEAI